MASVPNKTLYNQTVNDDDSYEHMSDLQRFSQDYAQVHGYLAVCLCIFGILANVVNIIVLTRKSMYSHTTFFVLIWLAVADLLTLSDYLPFAMHFYIFKYPDLYFAQTRSYGWVCFLLFHASFSVLCHSFAVWMTISLAGYRFLIICFPVWGNRYCKPIGMKIWIIGVLIVVLGLCVPSFMIYDIFEMRSGTEIVYTIIQRKGDFYDMVDIVNKLIQAFVFKIIPCVLLVVMTVLLVITIYKMSNDPLECPDKDEDSVVRMRRRRQKRNNVTITLLAVVICFLVAELPVGILTAMCLVEGSYFVELYLPLGDILDTLALCNCAANLVLYGALSRLFRKTLVETFCDRCRAGMKSDPNVTGMTELDAQTAPLAHGD